MHSPGYSTRTLDIERVTLTPHDSLCTTVVRSELLRSLILDSVSNNVRGVSCELPFPFIGDRKEYCISFAADASTIVQ